MKKFFWFIILLLFCPCLFADGSGADLPKGVVAVVNGANISQSLFDFNVKLNIERNGQKDTPELRKLILDELVARELLAQDAIKQGLDKTTQSKDQFEQIRQNFLADLALNQYFTKYEIKDEDVRAEFDRQIALVGDASSAKEYLVRHIIVPKEQDAKQILLDLKDGGSFEELAKKYSIDSNKERGGSVGWVLPHQMPPVISNIVINLSKNTYTQIPLQTSMGWVIVKLDDTRPYKMPTFDESKNQIKKIMVQSKKLELVKKLKDSSKIKYR